MLIFLILITVMSIKIEHCSQASPGNLQEFEEVLFGNNDMSASAVVMAIKLGTDSVGQKVLSCLLACSYFLFVLDYC